MHVDQLARIARNAPTTFRVARSAGQELPRVGTRAMLDRPAVDARSGRRGGSDGDAADGPDGGRRRGGGRSGHPRCRARRVRRRRRAARRAGTVPPCQRRRVRPPRHTARRPARAACAVRRTRRPLRRADTPTSAAPVDGPGFAPGAGAGAPVARGAHRGRTGTHRRHLPGRDRRPRAAQAVHRVRERRRERRVRRLPAWHARRDLRAAGGDRGPGRRADLPGRRLRHPDAGPRCCTRRPMAAGLRPAPRGGPVPRGGAQLVRGAADGPPRHDPAQEGADARRPPVGAAARPARQLRLGRLRRGAAAGPRPARRRAQRLLPPRARARRRRDRVPDRDGRPGRGRGGERPAARRGPGRGGVATSGTGWPASCTTPPASGCSP